MRRQGDILEDVKFLPPPKLAAGAQTKVVNCGTSNKKKLTASADFIKPTSR